MERKQELVQRGKDSYVFGTALSLVPSSALAEIEQYLASNLTQELQQLKQGCNCLNFEATAESSY